MNTRTKHIWGIALSLFLLVSSGCGSDTKTQGNKTISVSVQAVKEQMVPVTLETVGTVQSFNSVTVIPQVSGRITQVYYRQGQDVQAGDILAQVDPAPFQQQVNQAEAQLAAAQQQGNYSQETASRYAALYADGAISKQDYEQRNSTAGAQQATVRQLEAALENARINLEHTKITAPISGRTGAISANVGAMVMANQTQMVVINQMEPIYVQFTVPEKELPKVSAVQAQAPIKVEVKGSEDKVKLGEGVISFIDNTIDRATGTIGLKAEFMNTNRLLWPGQFLQVILQLGDPQKGLVVPLSAVMNGQQGKYVFIVQGENKVKMQPVEVDRTVGDIVVISKGLSVGDTVVTDGQLNLKNGSTISIKEAVNTKKEGEKK